MTRRKVLVLILALSLLVVPLAAEAEQSMKVSRIGLLVPGAAPRSAPFYMAFEQQLRELGYVEGQNLAIEFRNAEGKVERLPGLAAELVRLNVDVIVATGPEVTLRAVRQATSTIPIVMVAIDYDPIALGYVAGLARPGGNVTGVLFRQIELTAKRLEILKEALPKVTRVAILWDTFSADQLRAADAAARSLGVQLQSLELRNPPYDYERAFAASVRGRAGALLVLMSPLFYRERDRIIGLAAEHRLPATFGLRAFAEAGGLMAYGANQSEMYRRAATYVDKILKGTKPADLPVEQPMRFELVINLKTAKALGLTIPQSVLMRADELIQ